MATTVIEGQEVATSLGPGPLEEGGAECERLRDELLSGAGFFLARGVLPPERAERCRRLCEARGRQPPYKGGLKARILNLLDLDDAFGENLLALDARVGPVLRAVMGPRCFLTTYHCFTLNPEGGGPYRPSVRADLNDFTDAEIEEGFEPAGESSRGDALVRRRPRLSPEQVRTAWGHDAHTDRPFPTVNTIIMLSPFTGRGGATRLLRNTWPEHRQPRESPEDRQRFIEGSIPAVGEPGDVLVYVGETWHCEGVNLAEVPRVALLGGWLPESWSNNRQHHPDPTRPDWGDPARLRQLPPAVAELLGWDRESGRERPSQVPLQEPRL